MFFASCHVRTVVWQELEKENAEFFEAYAKTREERLSEDETRERILKMLAADSSKATSDDD